MLCPKLRVPYGYRQQSPACAFSTPFCTTAGMARGHALHIQAVYGKHFWKLSAESVSMELPA